MRRVIHFGDPLKTRESINPLPRPCCQAVLWGGVVPTGDEVNPSHDAISDAILRFWEILRGALGTTHAQAREQGQADIDALAEAERRISAKYANAEFMGKELSERAQALGIMFSPHARPAVRAAILDHLGNPEAPTDIDECHLTWCRYADPQPGTWPHPVTRINRHTLTGPFPPSVKVTVGGRRVHSWQQYDIARQAMGGLSR